MKKVIIIFLLLCLIVSTFSFGRALASQSYLEAPTSTYDGFVSYSSDEYITVNGYSDGEIDYTHTTLNVGQKSNFTTLYSGTEDVSYHCSVFAGDGSLIRFRTTNPSTYSDIEYQRITGTISEASSWNSWSSMSKNAIDISCCSYGAYVDIFAVVSGGSIHHNISSDNGASWSGWEDTHLDTNVGSPITASRKDASSWRVFSETLTWWDSNYDYRRQVAFDNSTVSGNVTNITVLIELDDTNFDFSHVESTGYDIRFVDEDGSTELDFWRESWDYSNEEALLWVEVPQIDADDIDYIWMYYGYSSATDSTDQNGTYSSSYILSANMDDGYDIEANDVDEIKAATTITDATFNGNDGTLYPTPTELSVCDATTDWTGTSLSNDTSIKVEGTGSLKDIVAGPVATNDYDTTFDPAGSWDWSGDKHLVFWIRSNRASTAFEDVEVYIIDTDTDSRMWDITFSADAWTKQKLLLSGGDGDSGTPDLSIMDSIVIRFTAADATTFTKYIDYLIVDDMPVFTDGEIGRALNFDSIDDMVDFGDLGTAKSAEFWISLDSTTESIFEEVDDTGVSVSGGTISYTNWDECYVDGADTDTIAADGFHHVVLTSTTNVDVSAFRFGLIDTTYLDADVGNIWVYSSELSADNAKSRYLQTSASYIDTNVELDETIGIFVAGDKILDEYSFTSLSGIASSYSQDYNVVFTGQVSTVDGVYTIVYGDGGFQPSSTWSSINEVITSSSVTYSLPSLEYVDGSSDFRLLYLEYDSIYTLYVTETVNVDFTSPVWLTPYEFYYGSGFYNYGLDFSYAGSGSDLYINAPHRVYRVDTENPYGELYTIYRGSLNFDTSDLPKDAVIVSATVELYGNLDEADTSFNITLVPGNIVHSPLVAADYGLLGESDTSCGTLATGSFVTNDYNDIVLNSVGEDEIIRKGTTTFGVKSSRDISAITPTGDEYVKVWTYEAEYIKRPKLTIVYTVPTLGAPTYLTVEGVSVFDSYDVDGDQLIAIEYKCIYIDDENEPTEDPGEYFFLQLYDVDGTTLLAQSKMPLWGHSPGVIYLAEDATIDPADDYVIKIIGNSDKFVSPEEAYYTITEEDFKGSNLLRLDRWVVGVIDAMSEYTDATLTTTVGDSVKLSGIGAAIFQTGVPGLKRVRPGLFEISDIELDINSENEYDNEYSDSLSGNFGDTIMTAFNNLGAKWGVGGDFLATMFWMFIMLMVAGVAVVASGSSIVGLVIAIPILFVGNYLGVIPVVLTALIGVGCAAFLLHSVILRQT